MTGRPTVAEVDLVAIRDNAETVRGRLGPGVRLVAVVKADGYGHGAGPVARAALAGGAEALSVALAEEGASLRAQGIDAPILVMGPTLGAQAAIALQAGLETTIYDSVSARLLAEAAEREGVRAPRPRCSIRVPGAPPPHRPARRRFPWSQAPSPPPDSPPRPLLRPPPMCADLSE